MKLDTRFFLRISLFNLLVVALFGTVMRYKIGFDFPYLDQKHLQHAHSHFAFIGWITHTLFVLMLHVISRDQPLANYSYHKKLVVTNLVCSYGMLIAFAVQGYAFFSIGFSTLSVITAWLMAARIFKDFGNIGHKPYTLWFIAALWFNIISSLGTFTLAFMMASHNFNSNIHLGALYFYLHFQYNGFFTFACFGLLMASVSDLLPAFKEEAWIFKLFFLSCIPAYFLSTLWANLPAWLYIIVILAAVVQVLAWGWFLYSISKSLDSATDLFRRGRWFFMLVGFSLTVKFLLQLGSTIPVVSQMAFGFRPIVIAYLHLILLAIISVFLLSYMYIFGHINTGRTARTGLLLFIAGVYANEIALGIQGVSALAYIQVPYVNTVLFALAVLMFAGLLLLIIGQRNKQKQLGEM